VSDERSATIDIGGDIYELILTTRATKAIANRYGGLDSLGEKLMKSESIELALDEIVWLIALLANQSVMIWNIHNHDNPKPLLTEDDLELLTTPLELSTYKDAITAAMFRGTARAVESETEAKNIAGA
jgi:hypothetical protein